MALEFGTDGVRGVANADLTPDLVLALGRAAARVLGGTRFLVGRDTRRSGPALQAALAAGLASEGVDVVGLGVVPTPAVARHCHVTGLAGAMISASHNPFRDNGVKLFAPGGRKIGEEAERRLQSELDRIVTGAAQETRPTGAAIGTLLGSDDAAGEYASYIARAIDGRRLGDLKVVIDCANGALSGIAADVLRDTGATVVSIADKPDGVNINERCGSTHPESLIAAVKDERADCGLAFDGDGDRVIAVDADGQLVDGDQILALCAIDRQRAGRLPRNTVVVTVMSNLGFRLAMAERGINVVETQVGDRNVLDALETGGFALGGEQSGHIIFRDVATTGDGLLTGLHVLDVVRRSGRPLADLAAAMQRMPQVLRNVRVSVRRPDVAEVVAEAVEDVERALGERGRVLVRPSGTEPVVRVMVEAPTTEAAEAAAERLVVEVERACS